MPVYTHLFQLVRFTPPREITPPPVNQQEYQSVQSITLAPKMNGHVNGLDIESLLEPKQYVEKRQPAESQHEVIQHQYQNGGVESEPVYSPPPPVQTVKSSTVLVLK
jgi:hypothetical protein